MKLTHHRINSCACICSLFNLKTIKIFYISEIIFSYITEVRWFLEGKRVKCDIPFEQEWNASCVCIF